MAVESARVITTNSVAKRKSKKLILSSSDKMFHFCCQEILARVRGGGRRMVHVWELDYLWTWTVFIAVDQARHWWWAVERRMPNLDRGWHWLPPPPSSLNTSSPIINHTSSRIHRCLLGCSHRLFHSIKALTTQFTGSQVGAGHL